MEKISFKDLTLKTFHDGLVKKEFRALEVAQAYYARIKELDPKIEAYLSLGEEQAMRSAEEVDLAVEKNQEIGPLAGAPIALKDNMLLKGQPATASSKMLESYVASYDAGVVQKLKSERAVFLGKTNLDEFAMGSSTENSAFQVTKNPHDLTRVAGGSSGGSAAAVAADMALASLGSDTGGSIREPAAFCGVVGMKPTYGAVSRSGIIALASSLDQVGPFTKTVADAAILFKAIAGHDPLDATSAHVVYDKELAKELLEPNFKNVAKLKVGIPEEYFIDGMDPETRAAVEQAIKDIEALGVLTERISLPHTKYALSTYYIIMPAEASSNLARFDGIRYAENADIARNIFEQRGGGFGPEPTRRIILGTFVLSSGYHDAYYKKAQQVRALIKQDFDRAFEKVDVILGPVTPTTAFKVGEKSNDPLAMYLSDIFTIPANLAGIPAISIPVKGREGKLPVGFQLIGKAFREADILGLGQLYENA
jgi:aspartyl-tRNA(Asn)/glutamyl-tRNA(Gln) amidotransferase subunit A